MWYRKLIFAQGLPDFLSSLGVKPEVQQYVLSLPKQEAQYHVNYIRQNPQISLEELQGNIQQPQQKQMYFPEELEIAQKISNRTPKNVSKWILSNLKNERESRLDIPHAELISPSTTVIGYFHLWDALNRWQRTNGLADLLRAYPNLDISPYDHDKVEELIIEYHEVMAGKGEGLMYAPTKPEMIVYGPKWKEGLFARQGWTIQEVRGENDLLAEGNKQNNCVGDYCDLVANKITRIFSLRDPQNEPHVTIEVDPEMKSIFQIMGNSNSVPDNEYKTMVREWIESLPIRPHWEEHGDFNPIRDARSYEELSVVNNGLQSIISDDFPDEDDYGLRPTFTLERTNFIDMIEFAQRTNKNARDGDYYGDITETPQLFVDANIALYGEKYTLEHIQQSLNAYTEEQNEEFDKHWDYESIGSYPDEGNFETQEEYDLALEQWEKQENENETELMNENRSQWLPYGFIDDMRRYLDKKREERKQRQGSPQPVNAQTMNWFKKFSQNLPLSRQEVEEHLISRGLDIENTLWDYDEESGTVYFRLYSPNGKLVGMQEYRPHIQEKGGNDRGSGESWKKKRYFTIAPTNKTNRIWGMQSVDDRKYVFLTEGIFDAAPIISFGHPALALIGSDISQDLETQLSLLRKYYIGILDNDQGGLGGGKHKIKAVVNRLGGISMPVPNPYNDFGQMYEENPEEAKQFLESILNQI